MKFGFIRSGKNSIRFVVFVYGVHIMRNIICMRASILQSGLQLSAR